MFEFSELPRPIIRRLNGLWRWRWLVLAVVWLAAVCGWVAVWLMPNKYESRAHVFVQTETILEPVLTGFTARPDYSERVEVMRLQLLTRPNVKEVVLRSGLDETIEARSDIERRAKMESLVNDVAERIRITSPRDMYFEISYKHNDPEIARAVVAAVLNMLIEQDLGASLSENEAARRRLNLQIEEYEERLTANERRVADFRRTHAPEFAVSQGEARRRESKENELVRVSHELEGAKGRVLTLQNLLSATPLTTSGDELDRLKVELADLRSKYQENHPDIRGVVARIEQLESAGGGALSSNPEHVRLQSELRVARDSIALLEEREARLRDELEALDLAAGQAPAAMAELQQIERQYETTKKTYEQLLERRDRLDLTENLGPAGRGVEYKIFERPERALVPSDPPRLLLIAGVFVLAAGAGIGAGLLVIALDKTYSQADELLEAFGLPVLGAVSEAPSRMVEDRRRRDLRRLSGGFAALVAAGAAYAYLAVLRPPAAVDLKGPDAAEKSASAARAAEAFP